MHKSIIDEALMKARDLVGHTKSASAVPDLVKEAEDLAGALEFISMAAVDDGTAAGSHGRSLLTDFFKDAAAGGPAESVTSSGGTQGQPPASGKTHIPVGTPGGTAPGESLAPTGKMDRDMMAQTGKNAGAVTLFDLIAGDVEKMAAQPGQGPSESLGGQNTAAPLSKNENSNIHLLRSNTAPVAATKRQAKMPTRDRLKRAWNHASDTTSDATAKAVWPQAASKGSIKVAEEKEAAVAFTDAGHEYERARGKALSKAHGRLSRANKAYAAERPLLGHLQGKQIQGIDQALQARGMEYNERQHADKRQSLNPLGGYLTPTKAEKAREKKASVKESAIAFTDAGHRLEAERGRANEGAARALRHASDKYDKAIPLLGTGQGVLHRLGERHGNYVAKKHDDKRMALNPLGGYLTATKAEKAEKKGSAAEWGQVFDAMLDGQAGAEAQAFARHIDDAQI